MKKSELIFSFALLPLDALMILLGFIVAYWIRASQEIIYIWPFQEYLRFILMLLPLWIIIFALAGLYKTRRSVNAYWDFSALLLAVSSGIMLLVGWIFLSRTLFFSRLIVIYGWIFVLVFVIIGRLLMRTLQIYLFRFGVGRHRLVILGNGEKSYNLIRYIQNDRNLGYKLIGIITTPNDKPSKEPHLRILGHIKDLEHLLKKYPADDVILTDPNLSEAKISEIMDICQGRRLNFLEVPNVYKVKNSNVSFNAVAGFPLIEFHRTPLDGWGKIIKRIIDVVGSIIGIIILSPLLIVVAAIIKITSSGPIFFQQRRVKDDGSTFTFLKFRSMYSGADKEHRKYIKKYGVMFKLKKDPRVTPFGCFIRKTSIDELPQLFNVLAGDMSLVGPRPPMSEEVKFYNRYQKKRLGVKPGITGLWQVSGRSDVNFDDWVRLDLYYIENWTLWMDFKILAKTFWVVLTRKGAY